MRKCNKDCPNYRAYYRGGENGQPSFSAFCFWIIDQVSSGDDCHADDAIYSLAIAHEHQSAANSIKAALELIDTEKG